MDANHGTPRHWKPTQLAKLSSRLTLALPKALRLLDVEDQDPKRLLKFTESGERLECALAAAFRMLYNGHVDTIPSETVLYVDRMEEYESDDVLWRGDVTGDGLSGEPMDNPRCLEIEVFHVSRFFFATNVVDRILEFDAESRLIPADARLCNAMRLQVGQRMLHWIARNKSVTLLYFPGTVFRSSKGEPYIRYLHLVGTTWEMGDSLLSVAVTKDHTFLFVMP